MTSDDRGMVERIAIAAFSEVWGWSGEATSWDSVPQKTRDAYYRMAIRVLKVMREPTAAMGQAAIDEGHHKPGNWYPAMIEAAIDEVEIS